jgi:uncharacterized protein (TIGR02284 family)
MVMDKEKNIAVLNQLIEINNDRVEGYETAGKEAQTSDLKQLFNELRSHSRDNVEELSREVSLNGGTPTESTKITGKFFRAWMDMKAALTNNNKHEILSSCEFGEDAAQKTYKDVLENKTEHLTTQQLEMIRKQEDTLKADHDKIKALRDSKVTS